MIRTFAILALLTFTAPARAATVPILPAPTGYVDLYAAPTTALLLQNTGFPVSAAATYPAWLQDTGYDLVSGDVEATNPPVVTATGAGSAASAGLIYWFEIVGPSLSTGVPIYIHSSLSSIAVAPVNTEANAIAALELENASPLFYEPEEIYSAYACSDVDNPQACGNAATSAMINQKQALPVNTPIEVILTADASSNAQYGVRGATATADPYFQIDPTFADAGEYILDFSPGIGNEPLATPLPGAFTLFATALAGLGGAGWMKRQKISG